jgi:hypothetical protein
VGEHRRGKHRAAGSKPQGGPSRRPGDETSGEVIMDYENDTVGGYAVPVDPMDLLQCDSCQ